VAEHPASAPHEIRGDLLFADHGASPYWALRKLIQHVDGGESNIEVEIDGETWICSVSNQDSGLEPRPDDAVESLYEYRINAYGRGERKLPLLIKPRLNWSDERRPNSVPRDLGEATDVSIETAVNLEPTEIENLLAPLLADIADAVGFTDWNRDYFDGSLHDYSTFTQYERYYRIERGQAQKIIRSDGIFHRLFHLLADREGSKIVYAADNAEIVGYNHQLRLNKNAASHLLDGPQLGKQLKHYHPEIVHGDDSSPLYYPKIGAALKKYWNANQSVPWHQHEAVAQELEETLVNLLEWADVPTKCSDLVFIPDDHFDAKQSDRDVAIFPDPTPEIEIQQESILVKTLSRLSDRVQDDLEVVADGGEAHVNEISDETGYAMSTIYRAIQKLDELLECDNGNVRYISEKIKEHVKDVVERTQKVVDAQSRILEDILDIDARDLERKGKAWANWLQKYGAELIDRDHDTKIRIRTVMSRRKSSAGQWAPEVAYIGGKAWIKAGRDPAEFRSAILEYDAPTGVEQIPARRLLEEFETRRER
jgi:hypothetical protein